jgi:hypothetical protein
MASRQIDATEFVHVSKLGRIVGHEMDSKTRPEPNKVTDGLKKSDG